MIVWKHIGRLISFRISREEILQFDSWHLLIGIIATWLVGIGRWWDDPRASIIQYLGLGSVIYIYVLSLFIYLIVLHFKPPYWNYRILLFFISLPFFHAALYAIPVERFMSVSNAAYRNVKFLIIVTVYRIALLVFFLSRLTRLKGIYVITLTLLPVCLIIVVLTVLNLERAVFYIIGGIRDETSHDRAYAILNGLTFFSLILLPLLIIFMQPVKYKAIRQEKRKREIE
jgi:hypothetical protein